MIESVTESVSIAESVTISVSRRLNEVRGAHDDEQQSARSGARREARVVRRMSREGARHEAHIARRRTAQRASRRPE